MAVLSDNERVECQRDIMGRWSRDAEPAVINKPQLREVITAIDDWIDANAASFNTALPQPQRGLLSARQKAMLLTVVVARRFGVL